MELTRNGVLAGLLALLLVFAYVALTAVLHIIIFAITVGYVLYPIQQRLRALGFSRRIASALATSVAFLVIVVLVVPVVFVLYERREMFADGLDALPESYTVGFDGMEYTIDIAQGFETMEAVGNTIAVDFAVGLPGTVLGLALFVLVLYGILYRPNAARDAIYSAVPPAHHDIITRLHQRTQKTLFAIYVIQAVTAGATFVIAFVLFLALGYTAPVWIAFFAAILQFIPMIGPSILIIALAVVDVVVFEMPLRAVAVLLFGLLFVALAPDVTIRPRLAKMSGDFSSTLYFIGFVGGLLTLGAIGIIIGPLVIALLVEVVDLLAEGNNTDN